MVRRRVRHVSVMPSFEMFELAATLTAAFPATETGYEATEKTLEPLAATKVWRVAGFGMRGGLVVVDITAMVSVGDGGTLPHDHESESSPEVRALNHAADLLDRAMADTVLSVVGEVELVES